MTIGIVRCGSFALAVVSGLVLSSVSARAATITTTADLIGSASEKTASVAKFDTSLGTLNFVQIAYDLSIDMLVRYRNSSLSEQTATIGDNRISIIGRDPDFPITSFRDDRVLASLDIGGDFTVAAARQFGNFTLPSSRTVEFGLERQFSFDSRGRRFGSIVINDFNKNEYAGPGNFDFGFSAVLDNALVFSGLQPFFFSSSQFPSFGGTVSVTYDFEEAITAVPVPAALPLMVAGLAGIGLVARRRRA